MNFELSSSKSSKRVKIIGKTFIFLHCCSFFFHWVKVCSGCFRQFFFHWENMKIVVCALNTWLSYIVTIVWKWSWAVSMLVILDKWFFYRGGCLSRFDRRCYRLKNTNLITRVSPFLNMLIQAYNFNKMKLQEVSFWFPLFRIWKQQQYLARKPCGIVR